MTVLDSSQSLIEGETDGHLAECLVQCICGWIISVRCVFGAVVVMKVQLSRSVLNLRVPSTTWESYNPEMDQRLCRFHMLMPQHIRNYVFFLNMLHICVYNQAYSLLCCLIAESRFRILSNFAQMWKKWQVSDFTWVSLWKYCQFPKWSTSINCFSPFNLFLGQIIMKGMRISWTNNQKCLLWIKCIPTFQMWGLKTLFQRFLTFYFVLLF